jgi:hypothetical protein
MGLGIALSLPQQPLTTFLLQVIIKIPNQNITDWLFIPHTMPNKAKLSFPTPIQSHHHLFGKRPCLTALDKNTKKWNAEKTIEAQKPRLLKNGHCQFVMEDGIIIPS